MKPQCLQPTHHFLNIFLTCLPTFNQNLIHAVIPKPLGDQSEVIQEARIMIRKAGLNPISSIYPATPGILRRKFLPPPYFSVAARLTEWHVAILLQQ
ncbi:hypothetical protein CEXT_388791 [Caerostris extrusa]|uniref:Uncharacterized protein n=1 Tax=Caerostris extrusa TaxID=172846 RepID=A0AAV4YDP0_CAEEX|nr:hypothetical protein CEXT_388791 [Caerostris extrusa]